LVVAAPVDELFAGDVMAITAAAPFTVTVAGFDAPAALLHTTVIVFAPATIGTETEVESAALPFTVQVVPAAIALEPLTVNTTLIGDEGLLLVPVAGVVMATTGTFCLTTVIWVCAGPNALVQISVIVLLPIVGSATELVVALVDAAPFSVQVVPAGIDAEPLTL